MKSLITRFRQWRAHRAQMAATKEADRIRREAELSKWTREMFRQLPVERGPFVPEDRLDYDPFM